MSATRTINETIVETVQTQEATTVSTISLRPPDEQRGVRWAAGTVDNEHLDRKSSKCCCIYKKPRAMGESSSSESDSDDDTNPYEKTKKKKKHHSHSHKETDQHRQDKSKSSESPSSSKQAPS